MTFLFDDSAVKQSLYPFTSLRNAADIRVGILTIREKWQLISKKIDLPQTTKAVPANIIPTIENAIALLNKIEAGQALEETDCKKIIYPWHIFQLNDWAIRQDYQLLTKDRKSQPIPATVQVIGDGGLFIEEGATVQHCIINTATGPVYIGRNAEVMEGCLIRGPFAMCEGAVLKLGTKIYGATTLGPYCTGGGEIKNSVFFGYSNKGHDGYLGDSVVGEWCNFGAGTSNSNLLNTAGQVKVWHQQEKEYKPVGNKCGLMMGDFSRAAINTSFNTGTVVGVGCNIFEPGFPPKHVADFTWGKEKYTFEKLVTDISNWKKLKGHSLTEKETQRLHQLYNNQ